MTDIEQAKSDIEQILWEQWKAGESIIIGKKEYEAMTKIVKKWQEEQRAKKHRPITKG